MTDPVAVIATLSGFLIGAFGLYLNHRSRTSALREHLHGVQITFLMETLDLMFEVQELMFGFVTTRETGDSVRDKTQIFMRNLMKKSDQAVVILPQRSALHLFIYATRVKNLMEKWAREEEPSDFSSRSKEFHQTHRDYLRLQNIMRKETGTAELSDETVTQLQNLRK